MTEFTLSELAPLVPVGQASYFEFMRRSSMSAGLYHLAAGATDPQTPHSEDELYIVLSGLAMITVGDAELEVRAGSVVFVERLVPHRFHSIREKLEVLVFFAPPEYSQATSEEAS